LGNKAPENLQALEFLKVSDAKPYLIYIQFNSILLVGDHAPALRKSGLSVEVELHSMHDIDNTHVS
jgi:hypothetical protein